MNEESGLGHYEWPLAGQLLTVIDEFEHDREESLKRTLDGADWDRDRGVLGHAEDLAKFILRGARSLLPASALPEDPAQFHRELNSYLRQIKSHREKLLEIFRAKFPDQIPPALRRFAFDSVIRESEPTFQDLPLLRLVWETFGIALSRDFVENVATQGSNRLLQLFQLFGDADPSQATTDFLRRISRCFVWGFDAECIILCRGAIDTAFAETIDDQLCRTCEGPAARYGYTLAQRIGIGKRLDVISASAFDKSKLLNKLATELAHSSPLPICNTQEMVRYTLEIIQELSPPRPDKK